MLTKDPKRKTGARPGRKDLKKEKILASHVGRHLLSWLQLRLQPVACIGELFSPVFNW